MKKLLFLSIAVSFLLSSCGPPSTFIESREPTWAVIELRFDLSYDNAWESVMDLLIKRFDLAIAQKEDGYIRTGWLYTWTGTYTDYYQVRATIKFKEEGRILELKTEAIYNGYIGYDTRLLSTLKSDIMGVLGRTTR